MTQRFSWFGAALIVLGGALLLKHLQIINVHFGQILTSLLALWGIVMVARGFSSNRKGVVFGGTVAFLWGILFLIDSIDRYDIHASLYPAAAFLILGVGFFMMFLCDSRDWFLLIPMLILGGIGTTFIMGNYGYWSMWDVWWNVHRYWPALLIIFGLGLLFRRRPTNYMPPPPTPPPGPSGPEVHTM
jgi:hypothetical protein